MRTTLTEKDRYIDRQIDRERETQNCATAHSVTTAAAKRHKPEMGEQLMLEM